VAPHLPHHPVEIVEVPHLPRLPLEVPHLPLEAVLLPHLDYLEVQRKLLRNFQSKNQSKR